MLDHYFGRKFDDQQTFVKYLFCAAHEDTKCAGKYYSPCVPSLHLYVCFDHADFLPYPSIQFKIYKNEYLFNCLQIYSLIYKF